ncbi:MAG: HEPN domain-containing protein [archaeon GB-1867-035]|nr:HEPN domain-containing protein [Candidatus Culexmicrobium profundum]
MTSRSEIEYLMKRSKEFLETAKIQIERGYYNLAAFSLDQSLQLFLKAKLLSKGVEYPKTHSLRRLLEILAEVSSEKGRIQELLDTYLLELGILEDAYITSRYIGREFRKKEVEKLEKAVMEIMKSVP